MSAQRIRSCITRNTALGLNSVLMQSANNPPLVTPAVKSQHQDMSARDNGHIVYTSGLAGLAHYKTRTALVSWTALSYRAFDHHDRF